MRADHLGPDSGSVQVPDGAGIEEGGGAWSKIELVAMLHSAWSEGTKVASGTRSLSDSEVIKACHWPSW
jgi:hypothetical protein